MKELQLLSSDFDGTLIGFKAKESCVDILAIELEKINDAGVIWAINTGRPLDILLEGLEYFCPPMKPHYLITDERHLYYLKDNENWESLGNWNQRCDILHNELFKSCGVFFEKIDHIISEYNEEVIIHRDAQGVPEGLLANSGEILDEIGLRLLEHSHRPNNFLFQRSDTHLRFCHQFYNKGSALLELRRHLSIKSDHVLAVGDHHNDLAMLDKDVAAMVACPSNAHHAVKKRVRQLGGHISQYEAGEGTAEALQIYHRTT